nr:ABC transporter ATP-binding protein [Ezakiella coagulans]
MILDEPFSSLSEKLVIKLLGYIEDRIENNKSNIIVTHEFDLIKNLNINEKILENGRLTDC